MLTGRQPLASLVGGRNGAAETKFDKYTTLTIYSIVQPIGVLVQHAP